MVDEQLEARVAELESVSERLGQLALRLDTRVRRLEGAVQPRVPAPVSSFSAQSVPIAASAGRAGPLAPPPSPPGPALAERPRVAWPSISVSDLLGRRVLGWVGGAALLIGVGLFLALAIGRGWIGPEARVILAGVGSLGLMALGVWLYERHGRTEAAAIAVGVATAGQWGTLVVAVDAYRLLPPLAGVLIALVTAVVASLLAVRWAGWPIAALALLGGLLSPLVLGVAADTAAIAILALAAAGVVAVSTWQGWRWIAAGAVAVCLPQWWIWLAAGPSLGLGLVVMGWFTALGLVMVVRGARGPAVVSAAVLTAAAAAAGSVVLWSMSGRPVAGAWLVGVALAYGVCGYGGWSRVRLSGPLAALMTVIAASLADGALAELLGGLWLTGAWGASAVAVALLIRHRGGEVPAQLGVGAQVALTLVRVLQASAGAGHDDLTTIVSVSILAGACLASGTATGPGVWRTTLHALGLIAIAFLTAQTLTGVALVAAWCGEAAVLGEVVRRTRERLAAAGALGFLALALAHTLAVEAPPTGLVIGVPDLLAAALGLGAIAAVALRAALAPAVPEARIPLLAGSAAAVLYLGSLALITAFQPAVGSGLDPVLDLGVRQQGQVLLSAAWSVLGITTLVLGLRANRARLRAAGLAVLLVAVGKVFLYDLSTLTSIYRVLSLVGIGALCLGAAFAYQRLRPAPLPDLRATAPVQR